MHAYDRTMLARLGFQDPDKQEPLHDIACQYAAAPEVLARAFKACLSRIDPSLADVTSSRGQLETHLCKGDGKYRTTVGFADVTSEIKIVLRENVFIYPPCPQPSNGPVDWETFEQQPEVLAWERDHPKPPGLDSDRWQWDHNRRTEAIDVARTRMQKQRESDYRDALADWKPTGTRVAEVWASGLVIVEIKIRPVATGDIIRQMKLYREHLGDFDWRSNESSGWNTECPSRDCPNPACPTPKEERYIRDTSRGLLRLLYAHRCLLVTAYPMLKPDIEALKQEGILHARLGTEFEAFVQARRAGDASSDEVEV